ncbi:MAG: succinate:quinone oxidoreductase [Verrucomicrobia bacterium]|nr:succinate:quinone oxidoreductase [Verrucomicrobiota bacterium]
MPNDISSMLRSSIGRKWIAAITGLFMIGFVVMHMLGNLQMFAGTPDKINQYAHLLKSMPAVLWAFRLGLIFATGLHIWATLSLARENRIAKPQGYAVTGRKSRLKVTLTSVTMVISGSIILGFVVFHLLHFTAQWVDRSYASMETVAGGVPMHDVYRMVVTGFSNPWISGFYLLAMALLFSHLRHGAASVFQTFGVRDHHLAKIIGTGAWILAVVLFLGFGAIPLAVLTGVLKP